MSEQAKQSIESAFQRAVRASVIRAPEDVCTIAPAVASAPAERPAERLFVITISSFVFRLLTLFQVAPTPATCAYYAGTAQQSLEEAFQEIANLCCGALNRELSQHFPHLAMSIPYTLSSHCMAYLEHLQPQYLSTCAITINDAVQVQATLCMCCSAPVDFVAATAVVEENAGELEMF